MKTHLFLFGLLFVLASPETAQTHLFLPLESGPVTVLDYSFRVENSKLAEGPQPVRGRIVIKTGPFEEKSGKRYLRQTTSYRNIPYQTVDQQSWRREEAGDVYLRVIRRGIWTETLELPADVSVGREWDYDDGEKSKRKVNRKVEIELPNGESLADCIEVTRTITHNKNLRNVINKNYYCKDMNDAGSVFLQPTPVGEYKTETRPRSFEAGSEERVDAP